MKTALLEKWVRCSATCSSLSWLLPPKGMLHACLLLEHIGGSSGGELLSRQERAGREGSSSRSFKKRSSTDWLCDNISIYLSPLLSINKRVLARRYHLYCVFLGWEITAGSVIILAAAPVIVRGRPTPPN